MPIIHKLQKFNKLPTSLIVGGADFLGICLAESLLEQKSKVIMIDEFTNDNKQRASHIMKSELFSFFDYSSLETFLNDNIRIDYIFFFNQDLAYQNEEISTQTFMSNVNVLDQVLRIVVKNKAKFLYASSMEVARYATSQVVLGEVSQKSKAEEIHYSIVELQRYSENLVMEYHKKSGLNTRIIRLGEVFGEGMDTNRRSELARLIRSAVNEKTISIYGEGLQTRYYLYVLDATYGLIKALFGSNTNGEIFSLANPEEVSELSLAYKMMELNPNASEIEFREVEKRIYPSKISVPAENLSIIGWTPHVDFEKALYRTLSYFFKALKVKWKNQPELDKEAELSDEEKSGKSDDKNVYTNKSVVNKPKDEKNANTENLNKRFVEIKTDGSKGEQIVRVLPKEEDEYIKKSILGASRDVKIPKSSKDPNIVKTMIFLAIFIPIFIIVIFPILRLFVLDGAGYLLVGYAYSQMQNSNYAGATSTLNTSKQLLARGNDALLYFKDPAKIIGLGGVYDEAMNISLTGYHFVSAAGSAVEGATPWVEYFNKFEPIVNLTNSQTEIAPTGKNLSYKEELEKIAASSSNLTLASKEFRAASDSFQKLNLKNYPAFVSDPLMKFQGKITTGADQVDEAISLVEYFPTLMGQSGRQTYLLLFQNPLEIRSTGGWIGGYGILSIEQGQIRKLQIDDIYNADGKLQVESRRIVAPTDMTNAIGVTNWTLSLSNWKPDYQATARDAKYLAKDILDIPQIDGVISIDIYVIKDLLSVIGEVDVGGKEGKVNDKNLIDTLVSLREDFQPGSQRKSDFLGRLSAEVAKNLLKTPKNKWPQIGQILYKDLEEKHILLFFDDPLATSAILQNNWGGAIDTGNSCDCFVFPVDYNWSGNKVNAYVKRSHDLSINVGEFNKQTKLANVKANYKINYENSSAATTFEGGDYQNYLRVYLPPNAKNIKALGFSSGSLKIYDEFSKKVVAGWVNVNAKASQTVNINFEYDWKSSSWTEGKELSFEGCFQKQAGTVGERFNYQANFEGYSVFDPEQNKWISDPTLKYSKELDLTLDKSIFFKLNPL